MKASFARRTIGKTPKETHEDQWMPEDRTGSGLNPILAESGLDRTAIFLKIGGSRLDRTKKCFLL